MITSDNVLTSSIVVTKSEDSMLSLEIGNSVNKGKRTFQLESDCDLNQKKSKAMDKCIDDNNEKTSFDNKQNLLCQSLDVNNNFPIEKRLKQAYFKEYLTQNALITDDTTLNINTSRQEEKIKFSIDSYIKNYIAGWSIFDDNDMGPYSIMLRETNNNSINNIDILQVLKSDKSEDYTFFERSEKEGQQPQSFCYSGTKETIIDTFCCKFEQKTGEVYSDYRRKVGCQIYDQLKNNSNNNISSLKPNFSIRNILRIIFDVKNIKKCLEEMYFNLEIVSLTNLSKIQIESAFECLKNVEFDIKNGDMLAVEKGIDKYYRYIPHSFEKITCKFVQTIEDLEKEYELLETLTEIIEILEIIKNHKIIKRGFDNDLLDIFYRKLKCEFITIPSDNKIRKTIENVIRNTEGFENKTYKCVIKNIFEIRRKEEIDKLEEDITIPNTQLLWYGSKIKNWYSIFSQGCNIIPKDMYGTMEIFENIVYIANVSDDSSILSCHTSLGQIGFFGLVEAVIKNPFTTFQSEPSNSDDFVKSKNTSNDDFHQTTELDFCGNKCLVCKPDQVRLRYIIELMFL